MKKRLLDVLVCPYDKTAPLKLHIFEERKLSEIKLPKASDHTKVVCQYYCGYKELKLIDESDKQSKIIAENITKVDYSKDCQECFMTEVTSGLLECPKCNEYYPIIDDIAIMIKPELRNEEIEKQFTEKWADKIKKLLKK